VITPNSHTFYTGETCKLSWMFEEGEHIVTCRPKLADGWMYGFGKTPVAAIINLDHYYKELQDFAKS